MNHMISSMTGVDLDQKLNHIRLLIPHSKAFTKVLTQSVWRPEWLEGMPLKVLNEFLYFLLEEQRTEQNLQKKEHGALEESQFRYETAMESLRCQVDSFKAHFDFSKEQSTLPLFPEESVLPFSWVDELLRSDLERISASKTLNPGLKKEFYRLLAEEKRIRENFILERTEILSRTVLEEFHTTEHFAKLLLSHLQSL